MLKVGEVCFTYFYWCSKSNIGEVTQHVSAGGVKSANEIHPHVDQSIAQCQCRRDLTLTG